MEVASTPEAGQGDPVQAARQRWMSVLAKAQLSELERVGREAGL